VGGPRDELLALAAVAAADGEASEDDLLVLRNAAAQRGIAPLGPEDLRVRRPGEIDPPATLPQREALLKEMFWLAWSDDELDESELRVVRAFARAWGVDPQRVEEWTEIATHGDDNRLERWVTRIGRFLFPGW
jgi:DnaJ-domain-containing protein 1